MKKHLLFLFILVFGALFVAKQTTAAVTSNEIQAVMRVEIYDPQGKLNSWGSGVVIDAQGRMLTNYHVIESTVIYQNYSITLCATTQVTEPPICGMHGKVLKYWREADVALLQIADVHTNELGWISLDEYRLRFGQPSFLSYVKIDKTVLNKETVSLFDDMQILGYPGVGGDAITATKGVASGFERLPYKDSSIPWKIKTDAKVNPGNSGGGAFDSSNNFIGIPTEVAGGGGNIGYVTSLPVINVFLQDSLGFAYMMSPPSELPPTSLEGIFSGYLQTDVCPQFSTLDSNAHKCLCDTGFFAVNNSCIVGTVYCQIKGGTYDYYRQTCSGVSLKTVVTGQTPPSASSVNTSPTNASSQSSTDCTVSKLNSVYNAQKGTCECKDGFYLNQTSGLCLLVPNPSKICPAGQHVDSMGINCLAYKDYCSQTSGAESVWNDQLRACEQPKKQQKKQPSFFVGSPKTKTDLANCSIVGNNFTRLYFLRGSAYIKYASYRGKICFADEATARKAKYRKSKLSK